MATKEKYTTLMDAGLVGYSTRDKKVSGKPIDFFRWQDYPELINSKNKKQKKMVRRMSMNDQSKFRYIIHIDGHVSAYRLGKELSLGSTILKVKSLYDYKLWFDSFLQEDVHYLSVDKDLRNLEDVITYCKENDEFCKQIAINAKTLHSKIMTESFITRYMSEMINSISDQFT